MSLEEDEDMMKMVDLLDQGKSEEVSNDVAKDYKSIVNGINFIKEQEFKRKLDVADKSINTNSFLNYRFFATSGIAACLALALIWFGDSSVASDSFELQIDEIPAFADSATYDSLVKRDLEVDKAKSNFNY